MLTIVSIWDRDLRRVQSLQVLIPQWSLEDSWGHGCHSPSKSGWLLNRLTPPLFDGSACLICLPGSSNFGNLSGIQEIVFAVFGSSGHDLGLLVVNCEA